MSTPKVQEMTRMRQDVYKALERQVSAILVNKETTELQAGYQLGVQAVLQKLREGFVIDL